MTTVTQPPPVAVPPSRSVLYGVVALAVISLLGGVISVASGLSPSLLDAMGPTGRLSIPIPMIAGQLVLALCAGARRRALALIGSGLVAAALFTGVISGFFDGGYADERLSAGQRAYQVLLVGTLVLVGMLAAVRFVRALRSPASTEVGRQARPALVDTAPARCQALGKLTAQ
ncbi:hypothetical protein ACFFX1_52340 [Dactylosporangium sucinum]|uniref:Uncharacterized protein n=1 Tax=Dactylosporangium sucinum TaxID=1424081 RepID=A0A917WW81_9ACTN|nr:hypothetical protein [Dactylosporangium sucinum]GGM35470.1 hypothetical protein GCM10007977_041180 [Dactylosporangium sucinum]